MEIAWHARDIATVYKELSSSERGLTTAEANARLIKYGKNSLPEKKPRPLWISFLLQFASPLIYILLVAAGIVMFMGEYADGLIILFVLVFNAVVGMIQEGK